MTRTGANLPHVSSNNSFQGTAPNTSGRTRLAVHKTFIHHVKRALRSRLGNRLRRGIEAGVSRVPMPRPTHTHVIDEVRRINAAGSDDAVWACLPDSLRRVTGFQLALVLKFDESTGFSVAGCSPTTNVVSGKGRFESGPSDYAEAGLAAMHGSAMALHGDTGPVGVPGWARASGCHSGVVAPITSAHHVVGVVYVLDNGVNPPSYAAIERVERVLHAASRRLVKHVRAPGQRISSAKDGHASEGGEPTVRGDRVAHAISNSPIEANTRRDVHLPASEPLRPSTVAQVSRPRPAVPTRVSLPPRSVVQARHENAPVAAATPTAPSRPAVIGIVSPSAPDNQLEPISIATERVVSEVNKSEVSPDPLMAAKEQTVRVANPHARISEVGSPSVRPTVADDLRSKLNLPGMSLDRASERVVINGVRVALSGTEFALLYALALTHGEVVSARDLTSICWGTNGPGTNTFDVTMHRLRRRLANAPGGEGIIQTVRGQGYVLSTPKVGTGAAA